MDKELRGMWLGWHHLTSGPVSLRHPRIRTTQSSFYSRLGGSDTGRLIPEADIHQSWDSSQCSCSRNGNFFKGPDPGPLLPVPLDAPTTACLAAILL